MSLSFLSPIQSAAAPARSPLADATEAAGARYALVDGWDVPVSFGDPEHEAELCARAVGFADASALPKWELQGSAEALAAALGPMSPGTAVRTEDGWRCPVHPRLALVFGDSPGSAPPAADELKTIDLTAALAAIWVAGPHARDLFARFCALDLRNSSLPETGFGPGSVARTPGYVLRAADDAFLVLFGAAYGSHVWRVIADAAAALDGGPVGLDALPPAVRQGSEPIDRPGRVGNRA